MTSLEEYKRLKKQNDRLHIAFACMMVAFICVLIFFCIMALLPKKTDSGVTIPDDEIQETGWVKCPDKNGELHYRLIGFRDEQFD